MVYSVLLATTTVAGTAAAAVYFSILRGVLVCFSIYGTVGREKSLH